MPAQAEPRKRGGPTQIVGARLYMDEMSSLELLKRRTGLGLSDLIRAGFSRLAAENGVYWPTPPTETSPEEAAS